MNIAVALAALDLVEKLMPEIQAAIQSGVITPDQQQALAARVDAVRAYDFSGSQWKPSGRGEPAAPSA